MYQRSNDVRYIKLLSSRRSKQRKCSQGRRQCTFQQFQVVKHEKIEMLCQIVDPKSHMPQVAGYAIAGWTDVA